MDNKKINNISKISNIISNISLLLGFLIVVKIGYDKLSSPNSCPFNNNVNLIKIALLFLAISFIIGILSDYLKKKLIVSNKIEK